MPETSFIEDITQKRIAVMGLGFVGLPLASTLADVGFTVTGVDANANVVKMLQGGKAHFEEPSLQMYLTRHLGKRLTIASELKKDAHDVYIIAVGTPVDPQTKLPVMDYVKSASETIGSILKKGDLVIMRSTVPVGVTRAIVLPALEGKSGMKAGEDFSLVFAPERLVAGRAMDELRTLPQIIGGYNNKRDIDLATRVFKKMTNIVMEVESIESAEMAKIIDNSYRDFTFAYANQMACLCEQIGIDMVKLAKAVNFGYARNHVPVPSPGVGGTCLTKDPYILMDVGKKYGFDPILARAARQINESMTTRVTDKLIRLLQKAGKDPAKSTVFIMGFAFKGKPETSDMRDSPTLTVMKDLQKAGCTILGHDPVTNPANIAALGVEVVSVEDGFQRADAVLFMTNHRMYETLDILTLLDTMKAPRVMIDGWHMFEPSEMKKVPGMVYGGVGND
jgi:UDP-N-acetyl-D-mannosaminuronic acid dehydrogenase